MTVVPLLFSAVLLAVASTTQKAVASPLPARPLPVDCQVKGTCQPAATIDSISPAVDEPVSHSLVTIHGTGLERR